MNRCCQLSVTFLLLLLLLAACAVSVDPELVSMPTTSPENTPTPISSSVPTTTAISLPTSTTSMTPTATPALLYLVETESFQGAIFPAERVGASPYWPHNDDPWTPSETDILTLEEQLPGYLEENYPNLWQRLDSYTRQYWGTVTPEGNSAIYASFLCDAKRMASFVDWRTDPIEIMDGGDCYFQTLYDIEDGIFVWLAINGEA